MAVDVKIRLSAQDLASKNVELLKKRFDQTAIAANKLSAKIKVSADQLRPLQSSLATLGLGSGLKKTINELDRLGVKAKAAEKFEKRLKSTTAATIRLNSQLKNTSLSLSRVAKNAAIFAPTAFASSYLVPL